MKILQQRIQSNSIAVANNWNFLGLLETWSPSKEDKTFQPEHSQTRMTMYVTVPIRNQLYTNHNVS